MTDNRLSTATEGCWFDPAESLCSHSALDRAETRRWIPELASRADLRLVAMLRLRHAPAISTTGYCGPANPGKAV